MSEPRDTIHPWILRAIVYSALAATLWFAGPRAYDVCAARFGWQRAAPPARVELARVGVLESPPWLRGALLERVLIDLEVALRGASVWRDRASADRVVADLTSSPYVRSATVVRRPPDRYRVHVELRRPVLAIVVEEETLALVDAESMPMPAPQQRVPGLPTVRLSRPVAEQVLQDGRPCLDPRVVQAVAVAREWRDQIDPIVANAPPLLEVDTANLGGVFVADPRYSEVLVALAARDGEVTWLHYGRAESAAGPVPARTKARILGEILALRPGLEGVAAGDLRLSNRWRDCLVLRAARATTATADPRAGGDPR